MRNSSKKISEYRLDIADTYHLIPILFKLAGAPNTRAEGAYNALLLSNNKDTFEQLRTLDVTELQKLAHASQNCISVLVNVSKLQHNLKKIKSSNQYTQLDKEKMTWLIVNQASNELILQLCSSVSREHIKQFRLTLGVPVSRGRPKMPDINIRSEIVSIWYASADLPDLFTRYQKLCDAYPELGLTQLHAVVQAEEANNA